MSSARHSWSRTAAARAARSASVAVVHAEPDGYTILPIVGAHRRAVDRCRIFRYEVTGQGLSAPSWRSEKTPTVLLSSVRQKAGRRRPGPCRRRQSKTRLVQFRLRRPRHGNTHVRRAISGLSAGFQATFTSPTTAAAAHRRHRSGRVDFPYYCPIATAIPVWCAKGGSVALAGEHAGTRASSLPDVPTSVGGRLSGSRIIRSGTGVFMPAKTPRYHRREAFAAATTRRWLQTPAMKEQKLARNLPLDPMPMKPRRVRQASWSP